MKEHMKRTILALGMLGSLCVSLCACGAPAATMEVPLSEQDSTPKAEVIASQEQEKEALPEKPDVAPIETPADTEPEALPADENRQQNTSGQENAAAEGKADTAVQSTKKTETTAASTAVKTGEGSANMAAGSQTSAAGQVSNNHQSNSAEVSGTVTVQETVPVILEEQAPVIQVEDAPVIVCNDPSVIPAEQDIIPVYVPPVAEQRADIQAAIDTANAYAVSTYGMTVDSSLGFSNSSYRYPGITGTDASQEALNAKAIEVVRNTVDYVIRVNGIAPDDPRLAGMRVNAYIYEEVPDIFCYCFYG